MTREPSLQRVGPLEPGDRPAFPTEDASGPQAELAASNRAAVAYSQQVLAHAIGGFAVPEPGLLVACGRSPAPQRVSPAVLEPLLVHAPVVRSSDDVEVRASSAAELVGLLDDGAVLATEAFGARVGFARRLREHLGRVTRGACAIELRVLGAGTASAIDGRSVGGLVLVDGAGELDPFPGLAGPGALELGSAVAWNDAGPLTLRSQQRWSAVLVVHVTDRDGGDALVAGARPPIPSASVVPELASEPLGRTADRGRTQQFVRAVAPGGLVVPEGGDGTEVALAGYRYQVSDVGVRALAMVHAGPVHALATLDGLLGSPDEVDAFCSTATAGGWLERCHQGDLLT